MWFIWSISLNDITIYPHHSAPAWKTVVLAFAWTLNSYFSNKSYFLSSVSTSGTLRCGCQVSISVSDGMTNTQNKKIVFQISSIISSIYRYASILITHLNDFNSHCIPCWGHCCQWRSHSATKSVKLSPSCLHYP